MEKVDLGSGFHPIKLLTSPFRPGGAYIRLPWMRHGSSPTPPPTGTPYTSPIAIPSLKETLEERTAPSLLVPSSTSDISLKLTPEQTDAAYYRITHDLPVSADVPSSSPGWLNTTSDILKWAGNNFLKYYQTKQSMNYASKMAEAEIESQKAAKAIAEAQSRIIQSQQQSQPFLQRAGNMLSQEALKKYSPYLIPIAIGLIATMLLTARRRYETKTS